MSTKKAIVIDSSVLKTALSKLGRAVSKNPSLPVLNNILCRVKPGGMEMICSNTEITIIYKCLLESEETFNCLIPFNFLKSIVDFNPNSPITITDGKKIKISGPNDTYEISPNGKIEDFPKVPEVPQKNSFDISTSVIEALELSLITLNKDTNSIFHLVCIDLKPGTMTIATSDGATLVYCCTFQLEQTEEESIVVSKEVIQSISGSLGAKVYYHSRMICFETPDTVVLAKRSDRKYANYSKAFPANYASNVFIAKQELVNALGKCAMSSDAMHLTTLILATPDKITLISSDDMISVNVTVEAQNNATIPSINVNSEKFLRLLSQVRNNDIELAIHDATKPIVVRESGSEWYQGLISPIAQTK